MSLLFKTAVRTALLSALLALTVSGCKSITKPKDYDDLLDNLVDGQTKEQELIVIYGIPDASLTRGKTKTVVYLAQKNSKEQIYDAEHHFRGEGVELVFDSAGILKSHLIVSHEMNRKYREQDKETEKVAKQKAKEKEAKDKEAKKARQQEAKAREAKAQEAKRLRAQRAKEQVQ